MAPSHVLGCGNCPNRLWLPLSFPLSGSPWWVAVVCPRCKRVRTYSLDGSKLHDGPPSSLVRLTITGLRCEMAGCEHLVPLYGPPMSMNDAERKRELDSWNWDDLKC